MNMTDLLNRLDEATLQAEKNKDLYLRTVADLDTYSMGKSNAKNKNWQNSPATACEELLPSVDHLEMAIEASKGADECKSLIVGVEMVCSQIKKTLASFGVEEISAAGKEFDPNLEDCVSHEPNESVAENKVVKVTRAGYTYNGRLLRA
ncbi:MAG: nucleotide exchange factor GrpE [Bacilli bacterium]